jgi:hypothetical protein
VFGTEKFSQYIGIGASIKYKENYVDTTRRSSRGLLKNCIIFIDAANATAAKDQLVTNFERDINKAYTGMLSYIATCEVACGNWTYGFNGANMHVKFIQLLIASSAAGKTLEYYAIGSTFEQELISFIGWLKSKNLTVKELYKMYKDIIADTPRLGDLNLFDRFLDL